MGRYRVMIMGRRYTVTTTFDAEVVLDSIDLKAIGDGEEAYVRYLFGEMLKEATPHGLDIEIVDFVDDDDENIWEEYGV